MGPRSVAAAPIILCGFTMAKKIKSSAPGNETVQKKSAALQVMAQAKLPTRFGDFTIYGFKGGGPRDEAVALVRGNLKGKVAPLVRVHSQCFTGDTLASLRCDCRAQLEMSLRVIGGAASGVLIYLPQEGRGIGLMIQAARLRVDSHGAVHPRPSDRGRGQPHRFPSLLHGWYGQRLGLRERCPAAGRNGHLAPHRKAHFHWLNRVSTPFWPGEPAWRARASSSNCSRSALSGGWDTIEAYNP